MGAWWAGLRWAACACQGHELRVRDKQIGPWVGLRFGVGLDQDQSGFSQWVRLGQGYRVSN